MTQDSEKMSAGGSRQRVWLLLAVTTTILMWLGADELRQRTQLLQQQLTSAHKRIDRSSPQALETRRAEARRLAEMRRAILARLRTVDSEQMTRARLVYDLRKNCDAVPIVCRVRLAELSVGLQPSSNSAVNSPTSNATTEAVGLDALGVGRARAVLSGTFKGDDLMALYRGFADDENLQWKLNSLVVRGTGFELDVERLVLNADSPAANEVGP